MELEFDRGRRFGDLYDFLLDKVPVKSVVRLNNAAPSDFHQLYASNSRPLIFARTADQKPMRDLVDCLVDRFGGMIVKVRHGDYATPENYLPQRRMLQDLTIAEYCRQISTEGANNTPRYAGNFNLPREFLSELGADIPSYYDPEHFEPPTVWLGGKGCITPLHRDSTDNFAIHLSGSKRWTIFPPGDAPFLYMNANDASKGGDFAISEVDLRNPDLKKFPRFKLAHPIVLDIIAGETLYLPMGWAHYVENLETSLMVNYWLSVQPIGIAALLYR